MDGSAALKINAALNTPHDLSEKTRDAVTPVANAVLADIYALFLKTKNFHWHMSGPNFRDYHLMLDEHSDQLMGMTDVLAERVRKLGGTTLRSIGDISRHQRIEDNDEDFVEPLDMIDELRKDNTALTASLRELHSIADETGDVGTASVVEDWIDQTEERAWFLFEIVSHRN